MTVNPGLVSDFRKAYMQSNENGDGTTGPPWLRYRGKAALQNPSDMWLYQEVLWEHQPHFVIETGRNAGGTALWIADIMEKYGGSTLFSVDIDAEHVDHPRVVNLDGSSIDFSIASPFSVVYDQVCGNRGAVMLVLDAGHSEEHVTAELNLWTRLLKKGDVLIVNDFLDGGPFWGVRAYLPSNHPFKHLHDAPQKSFEFTVGDCTFRTLDGCWRFLMTQHGWFKCIG